MSITSLLINLQSPLSWASASNSKGSPTCAQHYYHRTHFSLPSSFLSTFSVAEELVFMGGQFRTGSLLVCGWWFETCFLGFSLSVSHLVHHSLPESEMLLHPSMTLTVLQRISYHFFGYMCYQFWFYVQFRGYIDQIIAIKVLRAEPFLALMQQSRSFVTNMCHFTRSSGLLI